MEWWNTGMLGLRNPSPIIPVSDLGKGEGMRERFELHCKTIGLIIFCAGVYSSLSSLPLFLQKAPDITKMIPPSSLKTLARPDIAGLQAITSYTWRYALMTLVLSGIVPILMGVYLMRSNNLFVHLCYPTPTGSPPPTVSTTNEAATRNVPPKARGSASDKELRSRYAPPGYSD